MASQFCADLPLQVGFQTRCGNQPFRHSRQQLERTLCGLVLPEPLSEREIEVLALIASGASNQQIAEQLVVSMSTVKTHINRTYRKLDARSRTQAVAKARQLGIV